MEEWYIDLYGKPVKCIELNKIYKSLSSASRANSITTGDISSACKKINETVGGYHWEFVDNDENIYKEEYVWLSINEGYFGRGLKPLEILILSQIDEYINNENECYVTDEQFSTYFNVSTATIKRTLNKLEKKDYIKQNIDKKNKKRTLTHGDKWCNIFLNN